MTTSEQQNRHLDDADLSPTSSVGKDDTSAPLPSNARILRPARALIGWLPEETGLRLLNSNDATAQPTDEQRARVVAARSVVQHRIQGCDQSHLIEDIPPSLFDDHVTQLQSKAPQFFAEGWRVALVDLARVCAFQPAVFTDSAVERVGLVDAGDLGQIARITLPLDWHVDHHAQFDEGAKQWLLVSRNPNLKIIGQFAGPIENGGPPAFGFVATTLPSFMQVATYRNRAYLRDGYHRSLGLMASGVRRVPALVRDFGSIQELVPPSMLPQESFTGDRPPTLSDYSDDAVSAAVQLPATQKMVLVQGLELTPQG